MNVLNQKQVFESNITKSVNLPEKKFHIGGISATVWKNDSLGKDGAPVSFKSITFEKNYKDKNGEWKGTSTLRINDLPKAALVLSKAYEYLMIGSNNS